MSIQLVARARKAGVLITAQQVFTHKTVARLAGVAELAADAGPAAGEPGNAETGRVPLTPIMAWMLASGGPGQAIQSMLAQTPPGLTWDHLLGAVQAVLDRHGMLRARLDQAGPASGWHLAVPPPGTASAAGLCRRVPALGLAGLDGLVAGEHAAAAGRLHPGAGVMAQAVWFDGGAGEPGRLLLVIHHLAVDGVSWRILLADLAAAAGAIAAGRDGTLPRAGSSFRWWAERLAGYAQSPELLAELPWWQDTLRGGDLLAGIDPASATAASPESLTLTLPPGPTLPLLTSVPAAFHAGVNDVLLAALAAAISDWRRPAGPAAASVLVDVEAHGRAEELFGGADLSQTVGWFTSLYPVRLDPGPFDPADFFAGGQAAGQVIKRVKEQLRAVPRDGIGYGLLRYLRAGATAGGSGGSSPLGSIAGGSGGSSPLGSIAGGSGGSSPLASTALRTGTSPRVSFNYLGRFAARAATGWDVAPEPVPGPAAALARPLTVLALTEDRADGPHLVVTWSWAGGLLTRDEVTRLAQRWFQALRALSIAAPSSGGFTPSDLLVPLTQDEIDDLESGWLE